MRYKSTDFSPSYVIPINSQATDTANRCVITHLVQRIPDSLLYRAEV
jgi:hypothetical protein